MSVVAESQIATPRNIDWTGVQPKNFVPTVYPSQIITTVSRIAEGRATGRIFFMSFAEKLSPMLNIRKTTPSCPLRRGPSGEMRKLPPQVYSFMRTPARM